jgi:non-ribosomal peptide synthetase component F
LDCTSSWEFNGTCADDFQIHIVDYDNNGSLDILYDYKTDKYSQIDIINMHTRIFNMIRQVLENENLLIHDIEIVTDKEKEQIISDFNNTEVNYPKDKTITEIIEEQVSKTPDKIALVFEDKELTYKELNEKANSLAFYLRSKGIRPR